MLVANESAHLGYCTSIHPGESARDVLQALERHVPAVKQRVSPDAPMGVGLRLSARAADELSDPIALRQLQALLSDRDLYVFTVNGFPYGPFHGTSVKERVYQPDWRNEARLLYSNRLADILAQLLDRIGGPGSISTVPGGFRPDIRSSEDVQAMAGNLMRHVAHLHRLFERTGKRISLALEPEPHCYLETTADAVAFFRDTLFDARSVAKFADLAGLSRTNAAQLLPEYLGVCVDTCHAAVEFEQADAVFDALDAEDIRVHKIQLSAGLRVDGVTAARREALDAFDESVYLHQVVANRSDGLQRFLDLPDAIAAWEPGDEQVEWRVHFHVPIFIEQLGEFDNTQAFLRDTLARQAEVGMSPHLEVETYTWDVLPPELRSLSVEDSIARELTWARDQL